MTGLHESKLEEEVTNWPKEEFSVVGQRISVHCLNPQALRRREWASAYATGLTLGWLAAQDINEKGDRWSLSFREDGPGELWGGVSLPRNWNGQLWQRLAEQGVDASWVLGRFGKTKRDGFRYWGSPCQAGLAPTLPKLSKGDWEQRKAGEMKMLGVLRAAGPPEFGSGGEEARLLVGWSDLKDKFLGWEAVSDMGVVHAINPEELRLIGEMRDFDRVERKLRERSWGREF